MERNNFIRKLISHIGIILSFLMILIVVYAPVIQTGYFYLDDYFYFKPHKASLSDFMVEAFREGRILEGPFLYILSTNIKSSESTKSIRFIGIIGIALFASVIYTIFKRCQFRADHAFLISTLICTLPPLQTLASWMIVIPSIYSALLSSLSALLVFNVVFKEENKGRAYTIIWVLTVIVLLVIALSLNQPPAMMYWAMGVIYFLNYDFSKKECRQHVIRYFSVGLISIVIYYVIVIKLIPFIMNFSMYRGNLVPILLIPLRFIWFLTGPLMKTMNLWNANPTFKFAIFIGAIIFVGIIFSLLQEMKEKKQFLAINYLKKYFLISSMVLLSYFPKLMVIEPTYANQQTYWNRTLISLAPAISILFFLGLINIVEFFKFIPNFSAELRKMVVTVLLTILAVVAAFSAHSSVKIFAMRHASELRHMKDTIQDYGVSNLLKTSKIHIRRPRSEPVPREDSFNEFKAPYLATTSDCGPILLVTKRALHDIGVKEDIQITHGAPDDPIPEDNDVLIIDMTKIQDSN